MTVTVRIYGVSHIRVHSMIMKQFISNVKNNVFVSTGYDNSPGIHSFRAFRFQF